MTKPAAITIPPICPTCSMAARLTDGREVYPHRPELADKNLWYCERCGAWVGCEGKTDRPLGIPAHAALRIARMKLHEQMINPLWMEADRSGLYKPEDDKARAMIRNAARGRVYAYLADKLGIPPAETHTAKFDLERCRDAWRALRGVTYAEIREWAKARKPKVPA